MRLSMIKERGRIHNSQRFAAAKARWDHVLKYLDQNFDLIDSESLTFENAAQRRRGGRRTPSTLNVPKGVCVMDSYLARLANYSQIDQVTDLNTSGGEASSSKSEDTGQFDDTRQQTAAAAAERGGLVSGQYSNLQPNQSPWFRLDQCRIVESSSRLQDHHGPSSGGTPWHYTSPEKVLAANDSIDGSMLAEFSDHCGGGPRSSSQGDSDASRLKSHWATDVLVECARSISVCDSARVKNLMWVLNELASPYGDADQRLASHFLQGLFCKITGTGANCHRILSAAAERTCSFDSARKMILDYQEASPWTTFGHVAGNAAMMEAFEGETKVHIIDINSTYCTQWPTLMEALATRAEGTPHLRLTTIVISAEESTLKVIKQIMTRLERFARLMGVPFECTVTHQPALDKLDVTALELRQDEALAVSCNQTLHRVSERAPFGQQFSPRDIVLCTFRDANPKIMIFVEDEVDLVSPEFINRFCEALRFYSLLFESLEESFPRANNERLMLERICSRNLVNVIACDPPGNSERQEKGIQWDARLRRLGLVPIPFSDDAVDDVRALLRRYKAGWGLSSNEGRLYLTWKEQMVICASAWKPFASSSTTT